MKNRQKSSFLFTILLLILFSCTNDSSNLNHTNESNNNNAGQEQPEIRIVSLNGTLTEVICELGLKEKVVATDITSNYPEKIATLPKVGHNKNISSEGVLSQSPTHVLALKEACNEGVMDQIQSAGVHTEAFPFDYSLDGMIKLTSTLSEAFNINYNTDSLRQLVQNQIDSVQPFNEQPTVLFIYTRGMGTLNVAGKGTKVQEMITLSGAKNVDLDFNGFKPLTAESLVKANPDVILLFDSGYKSLGDQLLEVPGVSETNAGKNNSFITMEGSFLSSFSPRMGEAVLELNQKIHKTTQH